ncbi:MAG: hypothetical protein BWY71_01156 [Planctomycetes bacterium ADurb.Bin412]|nr:MAG: hypothetical protein BWY71_01156 [Planctomycetes bacterium ADurb.Bin412]
MVVAPASMEAWTISRRKVISERVASWALNSTSGVKVQARRMASTAFLSTSEGLMRSICSIWTEEVLVKVWIRHLGAEFKARAAASISLAMVRARPAITGPCTCRLMSCTASNWPGELTGNPASIISTPSRASCWATSSFSLTLRLAPGDCSASRSVESNIITCSSFLDIFLSSNCLIR